MKRFLAVFGLIAAVVAIFVILTTSHSARIHATEAIPQANPVTHIVTTPNHATVLPRHAIVDSADGGGYFNPNCPPPLHWTMSVQKCMPPWHPGEP